MIKYLVLFAVLATAFAGYTPEDAFNYADKDKDGLISDDEYAAWHSLIMNLDKTNIMMHFTGPIDRLYFEYQLMLFEQFLKSKGVQGFGYTPADAAEYADANGDYVIDAWEFDQWYAGYSSFTGGMLKNAMTVNGQITKDSFVGTLTYTGDLLSRK